MNERIDKLMVKAGAYFGGDGVDYSNFDPKKFAELIVRECTQSIENTIETDCITDGEKMGCEFAISDLLKHFGVEE
jgi:hypothetical protein